MQKIMLKIKRKVYELRFKYYMRLRARNMSEAKKHLLDEDRKKYKKYMRRVQHCLWEIQNITLDAEERNINMRVWPSR